MEKSFLKDLNSQQVLEMIGKNESIGNMIEESYIENVMYWIGEELGCFIGALSDWEIGFYGKNFIRIKDNDKFINGFCDFVNTYSLNDNDMKVFDNVIDWYNNEENKELENYDDLLDEKVSILEKILINHFDRMTQVENEYLVSEFENMIENGCFDEFYYYDNDLSKVYQEIAYTKEYK